MMRTRVTEAGFTLAELLVAMAVAGFALAIVAMAVQFGTETVMAGNALADVQQSARVALERLTKEIRFAGYDPTASGFDAIASPTATGLVLQNDYDGDGVIDPPGACDHTALAERVGYRLVGDELRRSLDPPANTCELAIAGGVSSLSFVYRDANDNVTAVPADVRTVEMSVTMTPEMGAAKRTAAMADRVRLRNR